MRAAGSESSPHEGAHSTHYAELQGSAEFRLLRTRYLRAGLVMTVCFLGWYLLYVVMSVFARDVMAHRLTGRIDVALVFGVLQIGVAFVLAWCFARYVRSAIEPPADRIRSQAARSVARGATADAGHEPHGYEPPYVPPPRPQPDGPPEGFYDDLFGDDPRESRGGSQ